MTQDKQIPRYFDLPDGSVLGLNVSRFDERQRRLRLTLPKQASCWDYAPLIDMVRREPGLDNFRFTGQTAAQWLSELVDHSATEYERARQWYKSIVEGSAETLAKHPRTPDNHYCIELAAPPLQSRLPGLIRALGLKRASIGQWQATLAALTGKGIKSEELEASGVLARLGQLATDTMPTVADVLQLVDLRDVIPKLASESQFGFTTTAGWREVCQRIQARDYRRRGLIGTERNALHLIRFRHKSLGWSIVRTRYRDLLTERADWWCVLNERGKFIQQSAYGFACPEDAMEFAEQRMSQHFARWKKNQARSKWERYSLPGGDGYREVLLQLDDWLGAYIPRHYRTRNVLVHIRTSMRTTIDGRRVLFLDEVQSDWHADLHNAAKPETTPRRKSPPLDAPFRREWHLLAMKLMLWWAQRLDADGLAWSTPELQLKRWRGYEPPVTLYQKLLPEAALALSTCLNIPNEYTRFVARTSSRSVKLGKHGWEVRNRKDTPITKPFRTRAQAESFADQIGEFAAIEVPVLWLTGMPMIRAIPLYGVGTAKSWQETLKAP